MLPQTILSFAALAAGLPSLSPRQDDTKVGYLFTSFRFADEAIFMHLSNGNDALSYRALSLDGTDATAAILRSDVGQRGVRDSHIVPSTDGSKFWLTATDLNANAVNNDFNEASRFGSRSMVIWESADLANWSAARLTEPIVNASAGNFWAPESYYDPLEEAYVVVFSARFWSDADPERTGPQPPNKIMYVTTTDFLSFSEAQVYFDPGPPVIDATFLHYTEEGPGVWYRWVKSEVDYKIFQQKSTNGILGSFSNVGGAPDTERVEFASEYVNNEGALIFRDNLDENKFHLWIDQSSTEHYIPAEADTLDDMKAWRANSLDGFPREVKHGVVVPVNQRQYDAIEAKYQVVA